MSDVRVGNAQRTEVLGLLSQALDTGGLPLDEYDHRVAAVGAATYASQLTAQLDGLAGYEWSPHPFPPPVAPHPVRSSGTTALVLGIVSLLLSMCLVGGIFGILAILYSRRGPAQGFGRAMIGRVFGVVGVLLSLGAGLALWFTLS
jgi:Domain of unknown function (DUF1707)